MDDGVTSVTLPSMPDCNIRNVDESLIRAAKSKAAELGLTLRDFAIKALTVAAGWENDNAERLHPREPRTEPQVSGEPIAPRQPRQNLHSGIAKTNSGHDPATAAECAKR